MTYKKRPNYKKLYPTASDAVIDFLKSSDRKMEYQTYDLKVERCKVNQEKMTVQFIQSREDSLERLLDKSMQFSSSDDNTENIAIRNLMIEKLNQALKTLNNEELKLIYALFFKEQSEIYLASTYQVNQSTISRRKNKILEKLKKLLEI